MDNQNRFETLLFQFLKRKGFDFPTTDKEVEEFERKYGKTDLPVPEELQAPKTGNIHLGETQNVSDFPSSVYKMAALKGSGERVQGSRKKKKKK